MYENYTRQSLPTKKYRELLGTSIYVFNSNNAFMIENILRFDDSQKKNWYQLIDLESGKLKDSINKSITSKYGDEIQNLFTEIVDQRNRIIHGFGITNHSGEQVLATKEKIKDGNKQFEITEEYLMNFIKLNEELAIKLHQLRGF